MAHFVSFISVFCGVPLSSTRDATHSESPIARKTFQLPSRELFVHREHRATNVRRLGTRACDKRSSKVDRHSTAPPFQIVKSLVSETKVNTLIGRAFERSFSLG